MFFSSSVVVVVVFLFNFNLCSIISFWLLLLLFYYHALHYITHFSLECESFFFSLSYLKNFAKHIYTVNYIKWHLCCHATFCSIFFFFIDSLLLPIRYFFLFTYSECVICFNNKLNWIHCVICNRWKFSQEYFLVFFVFLMTTLE